MNSTQDLNPAAMFYHTETRDSLLYAVMISFGVLSTIFVVLRICTRTLILSAIGTDDVLIIFAQLLNITGIILAAMNMKYGLGSHLWTLSLNNISSFLKSFYASAFVYVFDMNAVKLSILFQIRHIFVTPVINMVTLITIIFIITWTITSLILQSLLCIPISTLWDFSGKGKCVDLGKVYVSMAAINIVADFIIWAIPLPVINTLRLTRKQKFILYFSFSLGFFACCVSILRIHSIQVTQSSLDPTWDAAGLVVWSIIEISTAIICACLPTLRPLVMKFMPSILASMTSMRDGKDHTGATKPSQILSGTFSEVGVENTYDTGILQDDSVVKLNEVKLQKLEV